MANPATKYVDRIYKKRMEIERLLAEADRELGQHAGDDIRAIVRMRIEAEDMAREAHANLESYETEEN